MSWNPQANSIFLAAREMPVEAERDAYLAQACPADSTLREEVGKLLKADLLAGEFLERPCVIDELADSETSIEQPGDLIGPYRLNAVIGKGGMGLVFSAEQTHPVRRTVAIKIIRPGLDSRQVVARFEAERETLALMDHPNIAKVLDAGTTPTGRPYFAMEIVTGSPITEYCDERCLSIRERLQLFLPVCEAVQHAHQKGIIHRDLKPANVIITERDDCPVPKVIDFGVAKAMTPNAVERRFFTEFGAVLGTLEYMSPEQAELNRRDVDTRSDIYSLGVLMYELLTGTTPLGYFHLQQSSLLDGLKRVRDEESVRPSVRNTGHPDRIVIAQRRNTTPPRLANITKGDLDWIVMKALEKSRDDRYQNANELSRDIDRYLADRPIQARPIGSLRRMGRWCRRNRIVATLLAVVLLMAGAMAIGTLFGLARLTQESTAARRAQDLAVQAERERRQELVQSYVAKVRRGPDSHESIRRESITDAVVGALHAVPRAIAP